MRLLLQTSQKPLLFHSCSSFLHFKDHHSTTSLVLLHEHIKIDDHEEGNLKGLLFGCLVIKILMGGLRRRKPKRHVLSLPLFFSSHFLI